MCWICFAVLYVVLCWDRQHPREKYVSNGVTWVERGCGYGPTGPVTRYDWRMCNACWDSRSFRHFSTLSLMNRKRFVCLFLKYDRSQYFDVNYIYNALDFLMHFQQQSCSSGNYTDVFSLDINLAWIPENVECTKCSTPSHPRPGRDVPCGTGGQSIGEPRGVCTLGDLCLVSELFHNLQISKNLHHSWSSAFL